MARPPAVDSFSAPTLGNRPRTMTLPPPITADAEVAPRSSPCHLAGAGLLADPRSGRVTKDGLGPPLEVALQARALDHRRHPFQALPPSSCLSSCALDGGLTPPSRGSRRAPAAVIHVVFAGLQTAPIPRGPGSKATARRHEGPAAVLCFKEPNHPLQCSRRRAAAHPGCPSVVADPICRARTLLLPPRGGGRGGRCGGC